MSTKDWPYGHMAGNMAVLRALYLENIFRYLSYIGTLMYVGESMVLQNRVCATPATSTVFPLGSNFPPKIKRAGNF